MSPAEALQRPLIPVYHPVNPSDTIDSQGQRFPKKIRDKKEKHQINR